VKPRLSYRPLINFTMASASCWLGRQPCTVQHSQLEQPAVDAVEVIEDLDDCLRTCDTLVCYSKNADFLKKVISWHTQ
jgi:hypothetical protein